MSADVEKLHCAHQQRDTLPTLTELTELLRSEAVGFLLSSLSVTRLMNVRLTKMLVSESYLNFIKFCKHDS
jgi:hypothetical protein